MLGELGILGAFVICALLGLFFQNDLGIPHFPAFGIAAALLAVFAVATGFRFGHLVLAFMLLVHAMVGYVELGTDSWIGKITGTIMDSKQNGLLLFVYTSALMFILRFFAGPIVEKTSPLGLLMVSAVFGAAGLTLLSRADGITMCVIAASIYGIGKTFLWPTMLAVVSEQFPKGGAITIGAAGGVGMLSAGLLGGPGIGFFQDKNASEQLRDKSPAVYERFMAAGPNKFLWLEPVVGLDGQKIGVLENGGKDARRDLDLLKQAGATANADSLANQEKLVQWWDNAEKTAGEDLPLVKEAGLYGGRQALQLTAFVPLTMFFCYLLLNLYYKAKGGYKAKNVAGDEYPDLPGMPTESFEA